MGVIGTGARFSVELAAGVLYTAQDTSVSASGGGTITAGDSWRINLFRVSKDRARGGTRNDESAWSAPLMGDFHNLERFGQLSFAQ